MTIRLNSRTSALGSGRSRRYREEEDLEADDLCDGNVHGRAFIVVGMAGVCGGSRVE